MPGANAIGKLAYNPIAIVTTPAATAVAKNTAFLSIPVTERIFGLRNRMYAMVMNVVIPASISVRTVVWFAFSLNSFSIISFD
jgi:hypothetical protein